MITLLGYVGYAFVVAFYPLQVFEALARKNLNLGFWPLISLVVGLAVLQVSFVLNGVAPYALGNGLGLFFSVVLLGLKVRGR